jgi:glycosyltransferase involved in cell wall biosynthesis
VSLDIHLVVPGSIDQISGGYIYDRRIRDGLRTLGHEVTVHELPGQFPVVGDLERQGAARALGALAGTGPIVIDGLALPAFENCLDHLRAPWVALVHHPLALESGLAPHLAGMLEGRERQMLACADRVVATSRRTAHDIQSLGIERARIGVVEPGTDQHPLVAADGEPPVLLTVGALIPRKGHDLLLEALAGLMEHTWRLVVTGDTTRDPATVSRIQEILDTRGLRGRVEIAGEVDEDALARAYCGADIFVLPSRHEGYGMALAEALAHGLPIVSTRAGAIPETVAEGAGILVPPDDVVALRDALRRVLSEPSVRARLRKGAREARLRLPSWHDAAAAFARELEVLHR